MRFRRHSGAGRCTRPTLRAELRARDAFAKPSHPVHVGHAGECRAIRLDEAYWSAKPVVEVNVPCFQRGRHSRGRCEPRPTAAYAC
jgi:hypothetical protein